MPTVAKAPVAVLPNVSMSQSGLMVAALIGGFVVYLAMQGKLGAYWTLMTGGGGSSSTTAPAATSTAPSPSTSSTPSATTTAPSNASLGLPASFGSFLGLGGTSNPTATATGGTGTPVGTGIVGLPNVSMSQFFGLQ